MLLMKLFKLFGDEDGEYKKLKDFIINKLESYKKNKKDFTDEEIRKAIKADIKEHNGLFTDDAKYDVIERLTGIADIDEQPEGLWERVDKIYENEFNNKKLESKKIKEENINDIFNQISDIVKEVANLDDRFSLLENTDKCVIAGVKLKNFGDWEFRENEKSLNDSTPKIWSDACRYFRKKVNPILAKYGIETLIPERLPCLTGECTYYSDASVYTDNFNVWTICDLYDNKEFTVGIRLR